MRYPGGKAKTFHQILNLIPPHDVYIEAYLGRASVLRNKRPSSTEIGVDRDARVLDDDSLKRRGVQLVHTNALDFLKNYSFNGHEVVYCDPPYLPSTRRQKNIYRYEVDSDHHEELLRLATSFDAKVLISGYQSELYNEVLRDWNVHRFQSKTHVDVREEYVWFNFEPPTALHDYRYLGGNFRERHTIKRRVTRLQKRIESLPILEQAQLRDWLLKKEQDDAA